MSCFLGLTEPSPGTSQPDGSDDGVALSPLRYPARSALRSCDQQRQAFATIRPIAAPCRLRLFSEPTLPDTNPVPSLNVPTKETGEGFGDFPEVRWRVNPRLMRLTIRREMARIVSCRVLILFYLLAVCKHAMVIETVLGEFRQQSKAAPSDGVE